MRNEEIKHSFNHERSVIDRLGQCHTANDQEELKPPWEGNEPPVAVGACPESGGPPGPGPPPALAAVGGEGRCGCESAGQALQRGTTGLQLIKEGKAEKPE